MKKIVFLAVLFGLSIRCFAQEQPSSSSLTTIILVRHAEKSADGSGDPVLTADGEKRAKALSTLLVNTTIDKIYSTPFKRTRQTVKPLAMSKSLEIEEYNPFKMEEVMKFINDHAGKTIVLSGHSNTTPLLVNKIAGSDSYKQLNEKDYDNLYIVTISEIGHGTVTELQYGEPSILK